MAGMMYLGNQKVTPVIVQGGSIEPTGCVFRVPDNMINISTNNQFRSLYSSSYMVIPFPADLDVDFNNTEVVSGSKAFNSCFAACNIIDIKENIKTISGERAFTGAFYMATIPEDSTIFENLESAVGNYSLNSCFGHTNKRVYRFKKLSLIGFQVFENCFGYSAVEHIYFHSLKESSLLIDPTYPEETDRTFIDMLQDVDGCTVHFPSNLESVIGDGDNVLSGFGGTNTTVLFDLPETE